MHQITITMNRDTLDLYYIVLIISYNRAPGKFAE